MTAHEKSIKIIETFGMSAEKISKIVGKSQSTVYDKIRQRKSNKFLEADLEALLVFCQKSIKEISTL